VTDDDLDAAVERRRQHLHNRKTLGFTYWSYDRSAARPHVDEAERLKRQRERQAAWRARRREAGQ